MRPDSLFAALGVAPSIFFGILSLLYVLVSAYIYISLIHQISARGDGSASAVDPPRRFGLPEAIVAGVLIAFLLLNVGASLSHPAIEVNARALLGNFLLLVFVVLFIATFLQLRGFDVATLGGFSRITFFRALSTGAVLLFFGYPLILWSDIITQRLFGGGSSRQNIVESFSESRTLDQRIIIIIFAVAIAPVIEEFIFRFFLYNVIKRFFGRVVGITFTAVLFAAAHAHFPSFVPLFVLGSCFAIAYEWSGSILVAMTMHSLFNSLTLTALAFPEIFSP
jgi:membrane protease YdiL (CAAX protease family)